jgi:hypothetical protein
MIAFDADIGFPVGFSAAKRLTQQLVFQWYLNVALGPAVISKGPLGEERKIFARGELFSLLTQAGPWSAKRNLQSRISARVR